MVTTAGEGPVKLGARQLLWVTHGGAGAKSRSSFLLFHTISSEWDLGHGLVLLWHAGVTGRGLAL